MEGTTATRRALLMSGLATFVLLGTAQAIIGPALPVYQQIFALTTASAGWLASGFWVGCFLGVIGIYLGTGRIGPRPGLAASAAGAVMMALAPWWPLVILGGVVFGAGYGSLAAVFNPRILAAYGGRGPSMMGLLNAIFSLGAIAAPLVFLALGGSPRDTLLITALFAALIWQGSGGVARGGAGASEDRTGFRPHWPILAFGVLAIGLEASLVSLGPTALIRTGLEEARAAQLLSLFYVAYLLARTGLVFAASRVPAFTIFALAIGLTAACALGAIVISPVWFFPPLGISASLFFQGFFVTGIRKMGTDARVPSVLIASGLAGAIVLPLACARLMDGLGDRGFFWLVLAVSLAMLAAAVPMHRQMVR